MLINVSLVKYRCKYLSQGKVTVDPLGALDAQSAQGLFTIIASHYLHMGVLRSQDLGVLISSNIRSV